MAKAVIGTRNGDSRVGRKKEERVIDCEGNECPEDLLNRCDLRINEKGNEKRKIKGRKRRESGRARAYCWEKAEKL